MMRRTGPWNIATTPQAIMVTDPVGKAQSISFADLERIVIETNDRGPFEEDVWWLLLGAGDKLAVSFPQSADGEHEAVEALMKLPGFNYEQMIAAMGSTDHGFFPVWRRRP